MSDEISVTDQNNVVNDIITDNESNSSDENSGPEQVSTRNVIIVGGGRVGIHLIEKLRKHQHYKITLIDSHNEIDEFVENKFDDVTTILGDATKTETLERAGIKNAHIVVAATSVDEINLLVGLTAKKYNLEKVITRTTTPEHIKMFKKLGVNEVVSPELAACSDIEKIINPQNVSELAIMGKGDFELIDIPVKANRVVGKCVCDISPNKNFIIVMCHKNNEIYIAQNNIVLEKGDLVSVLVRTKAIKKTRKYFMKNGLLPI